jgi:hypothetical protein
MLKMRLQNLMLFTLCTFAACSQNRGPGYQFDLFKNTASWELAKAVEGEDKKKIIQILKEKNTDINLQEPKFGNTVLHLAIANDKLLSVRILLENNANYNIPALDKRTAIHEAVSNINSRKNSYAILELLIKYGADVNKLRINPNNNDTLGYSVPLMDAINNFACSKLLLDHGADIYLKSGDSYLVWFFMLLGGEINDNIYVAKYVIVDKKMPIPNPISYTVDKKPLDILGLLNDLDLSKDSKRRKAKEEIIGYLKKINFPQNGVFQR